MKTILVTGSAGFIGTNLVKRLLDEDNKVIGIDNLIYGQNRITHPNFIFLNYDVRDKGAFVWLKRIDEIYNLACPASPKNYQRDPLYTLNTCIRGTEESLKAALRNEAKLLHASTSEVYGDALEHPQKESYFGNVNPVGIRSCYDEGKRIAETIIYEYVNKYKVDAKIVRIFNTYGPYMYKHDGRVISNIINQAIRNEDITIYGDGYQTRSFCYIDDLVDGLIKMMSSNERGPINLGKPIDITMNELVNMAINKTKSESKIIYLPLPSDDPKQRKPDITLAINKLNWYPSISLDRGLSKTIDYYKEEFKNEIN